MSTDKTPEQIAEERYNEPGVHSHDARLMVTFKRQGYAACYREHVLNRQSESEKMRDLLKRVRDHQYAAMDPNFEVLRSMYIATMREWGDVLEAHLSTSTPPVTVEGIMELWHKSHNEEAKEFNSFPHDRFRSRLESYLTPNS